MEGMLLRPVYQEDRGIYASDLINPTDHQSTKNDRLKPVLTTNPVNTHIDRRFANLGNVICCLISFQQSLKQWKQ